MKRFLLLMPLLALAGCWQSDTRTSGTTKTTRQYEEHPTADGGKVGTETAISSTQSESATQSGVDPQQIATLVAAALRGVSGGTGWGEIGTLLGGVGTAAAGAYALAKRAQAAYHQKDADTAWDQLLDKHEANKDA